MKEVKILKALNIYSDNPRTLNVLVKDEVKEFQKEFADQLLELGYAKENKNKAEEAEEVEEVEEVEAEVEAETPNLDALKAQAKELKIKGSHLMKSEEKLIKAIEEKKAENLEVSEKALPKLENKAITNLDNK